MGESEPRTPGRPVYTKFYWKDFISDTQHLTAAQLGAYVRLLAHAVMCSDDFCSIPDVSAIQARIAGVDYRNWKRISGDVRCLFGAPVSGRCQQKRLMEDASTWLQHCEKQRLRRTAGQPPDDRRSTGTPPEQDHTRSREKSEGRSKTQEEPIGTLCQVAAPSPNGHANAVTADCLARLRSRFPNLDLPVIEAKLLAHHARNPYKNLDRAMVNWAAKAEREGWDAKANGTPRMTPEEWAKT